MYEVDLVLSGHEHVYQRMEPRGGVTYVVAGSGGGDLRGAVPSPRLVAAAYGYSYLRAVADPQEMTVEAMSVFDVVLDTFILTK
jgi:hypothetical protein